MGMSQADMRCRALASRQGGCITRGQALAAGLTARRLERRVASGILEPVLRGVYGIGGAPRTWHQWVIAVCLWAGPGAGASHRTAAALWALDGFGTKPPVEITTPRNLRHAGVRVHRSPLPPCDVETAGLVPVTTVARTLLDLGAVASDASVEAALENALHRGLVTIPRLKWRLAALGRRGRDGTATLRRLVVERDERARPAQSTLEVVALRLLRRGSLPPPQRQHEVADGLGFRAHIDLAYPERALAIEVDGREWHLSKRTWERDLARQNALINLGWRVLRYTWQDIVHHPERVVAEVRRAFHAPFTHAGGG